MIAMREMPSLRFDPRVVRRVGRADERERATERVDELLIMPMLRRQSFRAPVPPGRQLPVAQMRRQFRRQPVEARFGIAHDNGVPVRPGFTVWIRRESGPPPRAPTRTPCREAR